MAAQTGMLRLKKPARRFLLTPLVDVIFLLVIFFAMSSRIAPFVTLPIAPGGDASASPRAKSDAGTTPPATLILSRGHVRTGGRTLALEELPSTARAMRAEGLADAVLLPTRSATTQDVVDALQALDQAKIPTVRLIARAVPVEPHEGPRR